MDYIEVKKYNMEIFKKFAVKGTILEHKGSGVKWIIQDVRKGKNPNSNTDWKFLDDTYILLQSLSENTKKYSKLVNVYSYVHYNIISVPESIKILFGDPKDYPVKKIDVSYK